MTTTAGTLLTDLDEYTHPVGPAGNWNESRYVDFLGWWKSTGGYATGQNSPTNFFARLSRRRCTTAQRLTFRVSKLHI